jgi:hypothetical protein
MPARPRVPVPLTMIEEEFRAQLKFLNSSCEAYDAGNFDEFRRIALAVRVLLHDQGQSRSVAGQLDLKSVTFHAHSRPVDRRNMISETPLVLLRMGSGSAEYLPRLDQGPDSVRKLSFEDWWNEEAFRSSGGISMSRSGFILHTANQAGGAHVDPSLDEDFHKIANENEAGWIAFVGQPGHCSSETPMENLEKAYVRHIGFEVIQTLAPEWKRISGNRFCHCGSGRKFRYCHGKAD